ncbi:MAG: M20/M25/M40 family metallo-hydrolase [Planctomycetota bacterium]|jgi:tripeptide aminopeptidase
MTTTLDLTDLAVRATAHLARIIARDSQSDELSETIPSTEGQRALSTELASFFEQLGYAWEQDDFANLIVTIPASAGAENAPKIALMCHLDTSKGTEAIDQLEIIEGWDGSRVPFPRNQRLIVSASSFPETAYFVGQDLIHGPGEAPFGLDNKLGVAQLMMLAELLNQHEDLTHPEVLIVLRPDEEIGRMAAVEGLAESLAARGVRHGYTIDGLAPFEINVENFNAARGRVRIEGTPLPASDPQARYAIDLRIHGCKTHGATAKSEGHLNATVVLARVLARLGTESGTDPIAFQTDLDAEVNADVTFLVTGGQSAEARLLEALAAELEPHAWKGAHIEELGRRLGADDESLGANATTAVRRAAAHIGTFLDPTVAAAAGVSPLLSEDSEDYQGYSNPYAIEPTDGGRGVRVSYRLRDFRDEGLAAREAHLRGVCERAGYPCEIERQYVNMGPALAPHPELVEWAESSLRKIGEEPRQRPIRGGTGVDPFLTRGIPVANLGTGYFAPESEKELTSRQCLARHAGWLVELVGVIATARV